MCIVEPDEREGGWPTEAEQRCRSGRETLPRHLLPGPGEHPQRPAAHEGAVGPPGGWPERLTAPPGCLRDAVGELHGMPPAATAVDGGRSAHRQPRRRDEEYAARETRAAPELQVAAAGRGGAPESGGQHGAEGTGAAECRGGETGAGS